MSVTRQEWLKNIAKGEDGLFEFKEVKVRGGKIIGPHQKVIADECAAFANSFGGTLILGVEDQTHKILGIPQENLQDLDHLVLQALKDSIQPACVAHVYNVYLPDQDHEERLVMIIEISKSVYVHKSPSGYLRRLGSSKTEIGTTELSRLLQHRSGTRLMYFDKTPLTEASFEDLDEKLWQGFLQSSVSKFEALKEHSIPPQTPQQMLSKIGIMKRDKEKWVPTVAGVLMASSEPERFLTESYIQAVAYRGDTVVAGAGEIYQIDAKDITGPLHEQIYGAYDFVKKNMKVSAKKQPGVGRVDILQYDEIAIFEALTNAVAHRDYSKEGAKIRLKMFASRLELYVPGALMNSMTPETLPYIQESRNPTITSLLARLKITHSDILPQRSYFMDKRGDGVPMILHRSYELSGKMPTYSMPTPSELILTIYAA